MSTLRARFALRLANLAERISPSKIKRADLSGVDSRGWFPLFGTFHNFQTSEVEINQELVFAQATVFACTTLIKGDIGKLRPKLMEWSDGNGIWQEINSPAFSPVLRKPNRFQTWQKFMEQWVVSLLTNGNAYVLKERDNRGVVVAMYVLDPCRAKPLVSPNGLVYYQLQEDDLSQVREHIPAVPASEIIHDRMHCLFHPLVGLSPIFACSLAATQALKIQQHSAKFWENRGQPGGILTAPGEIADETALRLKQHWESNYTGENAGKVAVLGDGLKYEPMTTNAVDSQLVEQLKLSAEQICSVFHVPAYKVGAAPIPANSNIEALNLDYYSQCLQTIIESIEAFLSEGLGLGQMSDGKTRAIELDLDGLLRMDSATLTSVLKEQVGSGITKIDEARQRLGYAPVEGGDTPYLQQQNYSLAALAKRDAQDDPFGSAKPTSAAASDPTAEPSEDDSVEELAMRNIAAKFVLRLASKDRVSA